MAQANPPKEHLFDVMREFDHAMLVTRSVDGHIHARPMAVAEIEPNADTYFVTAIDSPKVAEIEADSRATLTFQDSKRFATLCGTIEVVRDRALIDRLWNEAWRVWFPKGKDDPEISLLKFDPEHGELWDNAGAKGVKYGIEALKAYAKGERMSPDDSQHERVDL